jgi:beta-glucosidase
VHAAYDPHGGDVTVTATVTNTSSRSGPATLELYLVSPPAAQEPPKQLKGYSNVDLAPGQSKLVRFRLSASSLAYYDPNGSQFTVAPGRYTVLVGTSSTELDHAASFKVGP